MTVILYLISLFSTLHLVSIKCLEQVIMLYPGRKREFNVNLVAKAINLLYNESVVRGLYCI